MKDSSAEKPRAETAEQDLRALAAVIATVTRLIGGTGKKPE
ncbi:hypothetical protein AGATL06_13920 [Agathobaculum sp. TL06]